MSDIVSTEFDCTGSPGTRIAEALASVGWGVFPDLVPAHLAAALTRRAQRVDAYRHAAVGRDTTRRLNRFVRRDEIAWIDGRDPAERAWLDWVASVRVDLNRSLMLGLHEFECHFAHYRAGAFYRRHVDAFQGESNRLVSIVAYLNPGWTPADGGELVLYGIDQAEIGRFPPTCGTLVAYLSENFPHEVLPTRTARYSIAGWFRRRAALPVATTPA